MSTRKLFWVVKTPVPKADNLTTFMCRLSWNPGASTSWNPQGLSRPVMGLLYLYLYPCFGGTRWRSRLRHCATSRKVAGSFPNGVTGIFHWHNPSGRTMALGLTQTITEMSTRKIFWGVKTPVRKADNLTTFMCRLSWNVGDSASWNPQGLSRPVVGLIDLFPHVSESSVTVGRINVLERCSLTFRYITFDINSFFLWTWYALFPAAILSLISSPIELSVFTIVRKYLKTVPLLYLCR